MIDHEAGMLLAAGAALDDLEPDEWAAWDAHRDGCVECARTEGDLATIVMDLALTVPERRPPPELLAGIRLAIDETPAPLFRPTPVAAHAPSAPNPGVSIPGNVVPFRAARTRSRTLGALVGIAAALAFAVVGLGARTASLQDELARSGAQVASLRSALGGQGAAVSAALDPGRVAVALHAEALAPAAEATVVYVPGTDGSWIVARNLPPTPAGHGYQLWYADKAGVHPLQTVAYDGSGMFVEPLGVALGSGDAVMITLEDAAGATSEPGPQVVFGEL